MKCMERNKSRFYYATYAGKVGVRDDYGNDTGEYEVKYSNLHKCFGNISAAKGETQSRQFGENLTYDKVLVLDIDAAPIDEYSVLWIDTLPDISAGGETGTPHDYVVKKVARSLNSVAVAISKVDVA